jgi:hypothetical protein
LITFLSRIENLDPIISSISLSGYYPPRASIAGKKETGILFILVRNYSTLNEEILEEDAGPKMQVMSRAWVD